MPSRNPTPWWGRGPAPWVTWPGVSLPIEAVWSAPRRRWESRDGRYWFDKAAADKAVDFFPTFLTHASGAAAGQPFRLLPWQVQLLTRPIFGWRRVADNRRRWRKVLVFAPKGAGKSPWGAGTALYLTLFDGEPSAEIYALARDREQGRIIHNDGKTFIEQSPELAARCEVLKDAIYVPATRSTFRVVPAEAGGRHGWRPHGLFIDEIQEQAHRDLVEVGLNSMSKRPQPLAVFMGHAGVDEESIGYEEYAYGKAVLAGAIADEAHLPVIFEMQPEEDWQQESTWRRVNPGYGVTVQPDGIAAQAREAANEPRKRNDFLRYALNVWTAQASAWLPLEWWTDSQVAQLDPATFRTADVTAGLDMSQSIDYTALTITVRIPLTSSIPVAVTDDLGETTSRPLDYAVAVFPYYWIPDARLTEREQEDGLPLRLYQAQGRLFTCPGTTISAEQVTRDIATTIAPLFPTLRTIGYDPALAHDVAQRLSAHFDMVECPQNFAFMTAPCYLLEGLLKARRVQHDNHPILRWNVANVSAKRDEAGRLRPVKPRVLGAHRKRIDGVVALLMGLSMLQRAQPTAEPKYEMFFLGGS